MVIRIHIENEESDNGIPYIDFGQDGHAWLLDATFSETPIVPSTQIADHWVVKMYDTQVVTIWIGEEPKYITVKNGEILWLNPIETGYERAGATVYIGRTQCGEGATCFAMEGYFQHDSSHHACESRPECFTTLVTTKQGTLLSIPTWKVFVDIDEVEATSITGVEFIPIP